MSNECEIFEEITKNAYNIATSAPFPQLVLQSIIQKCPGVAAVVSNAAAKGRSNPNAGGVINPSSGFVPSTKPHNDPNNVLDVNKIVGSNPYVCGRPGSTNPKFSNIGKCNFDFESALATAYPSNVNAAKVQFRFVKFKNGQPSCLSDADCTVSGEKCGTAFQPGYACPDDFKIGVCGPLLGYWSANQICATSTCAGRTDNLFLKCSQRDLYKCADTAPQSCYSVDATVTCCGCANWQQDLGVKVATENSPKDGSPFTALCNSKNPTWTQEILPSLLWLKMACPTYYSYPFDDKSSTFVYSTDFSFNTINTANYLVIACPSPIIEDSVTVPVKVAGFRVFKVYNNCDYDIWPAMSGGDGKNKTSSVEELNSRCNTDNDCYTGSKCVLQGDVLRCFWTNPLPINSPNPTVPHNYKLAKGEVLEFRLPVSPIPSDGYGVVWSGVLAVRRGCDDSNPATLCDISDCRSGTPSNFNCVPTLGFAQPATQIEMTLQSNDADYADGTIINGFTTPLVLISDACGI